MHVRTTRTLRPAEQLIFPSYDRLNEAGLLGKKPPTKPNFFAARILADEALASKVGGVGGARRDRKWPGEGGRSSEKRRREWS